MGGAAEVEFLGIKASRVEGESGFDADVGAFHFVYLLFEVLGEAPMGVLLVEDKPEAAVEEQAGGHGGFAADKGEESEECTEQNRE